METKYEHKQEMLQAIQGDLEVSPTNWIWICMSMYVRLMLWLQRGQRDFDQKYKGFEVQLKQASEELKVCDGRTSQSYYYLVAERN